MRYFQHSGTADQHRRKGGPRPGVRSGGEEPVQLHHLQRVPSLLGLRQLHGGRP
ncbi:hypothetical protein MUK42_18450 [Musa troglodytarum]|uniref:Uncharacterized protein n=1 Tax=Musa troglodytarum TaxID=320322 RepID=A0A9E7G7J2_9LILI|nr:hypothetical protein MUK42_18450 [Musa troglodytarum]